VRRLRPALLFPLVAAAALLPGSGRADNPVLTGTVGPGFTIKLTNAAGTAVPRVSPGTYTIRVHDLSPDHSFHLTGPGVDMATTVDGTGDATWTVRLVDGTYVYKCDAHPLSMRGTLKVGVPLPRLNGRVGPGRTISLRAGGGAIVKSLPAATYEVVVRDSTKVDNFHLLGAGVNKKTGVRFRGSRTWTVTFRAGNTYTLRSDAHRKLRRTFTVGGKLPPPPPPPGYWG
jgi:hypothetical protein